jgi:hypothetical protein
MTASVTVAGRAHPPTRQNGRQKGYRLDTLLTEYSRISSDSEETEIALLESLIPLPAIFYFHAGKIDIVSLCYVFGTA